jgi:hypothetical protein
MQAAVVRTSSDGGAPSGRRGSSDGTGLALGSFWPVEIVERQDLVLMTGNVL